jgi:hypothetical protein
MVTARVMLALGLSAAAASPLWAQGDGAGGTAQAGSTVSSPPLDDRLRPLAALIGVWDTEDRYETSTGPGVERGIRTCRPVLMGRHIECVTSAPRRAGGEREYRFYFSWDEQRRSLILLQFWSDVAGFSVTTIRPTPGGGDSLDLRGAPQLLSDGRERRSWGTMTFESSGRLVWTGRANVSSEPLDAWRPVFREVSTKRP